MECAFSVSMHPSSDLRSQGTLTPYLSKTSRSGPGVFVISDDSARWFVGIFRCHALIHGTIPTSTLTFIKVVGFSPVCEILQSGAREDFPPSCARVLLREDSAVTFHYCSDCALCWAFSGLEEDCLPLDDGDGLWLQPPTPLMGQQALGGRNTTQRCFKNAGAAESCHIKRKSSAVRTPANA